MPNSRGVVKAGVDWSNISKSIKKGDVFFRSHTYKNQTQKSEMRDICPKLKFNTTPTNNYRLNYRKFRRVE